MSNIYFGAIMVLGLTKLPISHTSRGSTFIWSRLNKKTANTKYNPKAHICSGITTNELCKVKDPEHLLYIHYHQYNKKHQSVNIEQRSSSLLTDMEVEIKE